MARFHAAQRSDFRRPHFEVSYIDVVVATAFGWSWAVGAHVTSIEFLKGIIAGCTIAVIFYFNDVHAIPFLKWKKHSEGDGDPTATLQSDELKSAEVALIAARFGKDVADHWVIYKRRRFWPGTSHEGDDDE